MSIPPHGEVIDLIGGGLDSNHWRMKIQARDGAQFNPAFLFSKQLSKLGPVKAANPAMRTQVLESLFRERTGLGGSRIGCHVFGIAHSRNHG